MEWEHELSAAADAVDQERAARTAWERALRARDEAVRALYLRACDAMSQNQMARAIGISPSTLRAVTADLRRARRTDPKTAWRVPGETESAGP